MTGVMVVKWKLEWKDTPLKVLIPMRCVIYPRGEPLNVLWITHVAVSSRSSQALNKPSTKGPASLLE